MVAQVGAMCVSRVVCVIFVLFYLSSFSNGSETSPFSGHLFSLLPAYPSFTESSNERCKNDSIILRQQLDEFKLWAVKMLDASSKLPSGILAGNVYQLGHFDECLSVKVALEEGRRIKGQYCLTKVEYSPKNLTIESKPMHSISEIFNTSAWSFIKAFNLDRSRNRRDEIYWALCVPDSCKDQDIVEAMGQALRVHQDPAGIDISVSIGANMCQVASEPENIFAWIGVGQLIVGSIVLFFLLNVLISTFLQGIGRIKPKETTGIGKFLNCFSGQNNFQALHRVDPSKDIMVVHTMRFISMFVILIGHRFITDSPFPKMNADYSEHHSHNQSLIYLLLGPLLVVDTFFLLSGFLTGLQIFNDLEAGRFKLFSFYIHRYIRLTPVYMLTVAFFALFIVNLGSGPMWLSRVTIEQQRCAHNWWTNLLYLNNYVNVEGLCMFQSWHLTCDFHFLLMAPPLVYFMFKKPKIAIAFIIFLIGVVSTLIFSITFINNLDANLMAYKSVMADLTRDPTFQLTYIPTHTRFGPYLFGLLAAYAYFKRKSYGVLTPSFTYTGAVIVAILLHVPIVSSLSFYAEIIDYNVWSAALYASLHRIPWSIGLCMILVVTATNNAYFFQNVLSWQALAPLSRLTYCVFLIHSSVQLYSAASARTPSYESNFYFTWAVFGDLLLTYLIALIAHLIFEAPILRLDRTYWSTTPTSRKQGNGQENRGFAVEVPTVFSNAEGPFAVTEEEHDKYRNRQDFYANRASTER